MSSIHAADDVPVPGRRRGRRPAGEDTRGTILAAARDEFAERGYDGASVRSVARRADVDPALVRHYFRDKSELFAAGMIPEIVPPVVRRGDSRRPLRQPRAKVSK